MSLKLQPCDLMPFKRQLRPSHEKILEKLDQWALTFKNLFKPIFEFQTHVPVLTNYSPC
jgi:hypothetical protein